MNSESASRDRLDRLLGFLEMDDGNLSLLADAADAAFEIRELHLAVDLLERYAALARFPPQLTNLAGVVALAEERFSDAVEHFSGLREDLADNPNIRFNLAWALAMCERYGDAVALLDDEAVAVSPRGPALKVQALHHVGDLDAALAEGKALLERHADDQALLGAVATLAMDADDSSLARVCAERAPDSPQALGVLGLYALETNDTNAALALFERALAGGHYNPRALVGKGLALLASGDAAAGAEALEAGATHFSTHLGSWIAAGWAHLIAGDAGRAKEIFVRSSEIDDTFSEGHGGLAVLAFIDGDFAEAERRSEIALRLDRESLGGTLSKIMLLQARGDIETATRIRDIALMSSVGPGGKTLLQALAGMNMKSAR
jgi:tetratricopeptide (TPR) repeat protein